MNVGSNVVPKHNVANITRKVVEHVEFVPEGCAKHSIGEKDTNVMPECCQQPDAKKCLFSAPCCLAQPWGENWHEHVNANDHVDIPKVRSTWCETNWEKAQVVQ